MKAPLTGKRNDLVLAYPSTDTEDLLNYMYEVAKMTDEEVEKEWELVFKKAA